MCALRINTPLKGLALLSGIYDLRPLVGTYINDALGLDENAAKALSPIQHDLSAFPPTLVAWGEDETDEFKRQSRAFAQPLSKACTVEIEGRNHFDIVEDLTTDTALGRAVTALF